jgi:hypothetical protein
MPAAAHTSLEKQIAVAKAAGLRVVRSEVEGGVVRLWYADEKTTDADFIDFTPRRRK